MGRSSLANFTYGAGAALCYYFSAFLAELARDSVDGVAFSSGAHS